MDASLCRNTMTKLRPWFGSRFEAVLLGIEEPPGYVHPLAGRGRLYRVLGIYGNIVLADCYRIVTFRETRAANAA